MPKVLTHEQVIQRFKRIHGDKFDYSLCVYKRDNIKIPIICRKHGVFYQTPDAHYRAKFACQECDNEYRKESYRIPFEIFNQRIITKYGEGSYTIDLDSYNGITKKAIITCNKHHIKFSVFPSEFLREENNIGCKECRNIKRQEKNSLKYSKVFFERCNKKHYHKYDYSQSKYLTNYIPIKIICPLHGIFQQSPANHVKGCGCPECKGSYGEQLIAQILRTKNIEFIYQYKIKICGSNHYFDFYIPEKNILIEYNGLQHYKHTKYFGGIGVFRELQKRDRIKYGYCDKNKIKLLIIKYNDSLEEKLKICHT